MAFRNLDAEELEKAQASEDLRLVDVEVQLIAKGLSLSNSAQKQSRSQRASGQSTAVPEEDRRPAGGRIRELSSRHAPQSEPVLSGRSEAAPQVLSSLGVTVPETMSAEGRKPPPGADLVMEDEEEPDLT